MNLSGGLLYHYTALKYKSKLWPPYSNFIHELLKANTPKDIEQVLLIGPSAGYSLSSNWLNQFSKVLVVEKDPLAKLILKLRFPKVNFSFIGSNIFCTSTLQRLQKALKNKPKTLTVFCNILGQKISESHQQKVEILKFLSQFPIISYHDYYSSRCSNPEKFINLSPQGYLDTVKDLGSSEVIDHLTSTIFDNRFKKTYVIWQLYPHQIHLIETAVKL